MECYNCGIIIGRDLICPNCGADLRIYRKFVGISNYLYNEALAKAKERDLSGAIADLRLSLQYNKVNTNARNLLGLIYFEMGDGVAAIREWLISKGYQVEENRASVYLEKTKKDPAEKEKIKEHTFILTVKLGERLSKRYFLWAIPSLMPCVTKIVMPIWAQAMPLWQQVFWVAKNPIPTNL